MASSQPILVDTTGDGVHDSVIVDTTGDGQADTIVKKRSGSPELSNGSSSISAAKGKAPGTLPRGGGVAANGTWATDTKLLDTTGDGVFDSILVDTTGDGQSDTLIAGPRAMKKGATQKNMQALDTTGDGKADSVLIDTSGDGVMDRVVKRAPMMKREKTQAFTFKDMLEQGKVSAKEVNEQIEHEFHTGRPSTGKELINECLRAFLPSLRLSLGRAIAQIAASKEDLGDFVLEVKPVNPRHVIDERFPERLIETLSVKLGRVKAPVPPLLGLERIRHESFVRMQSLQRDGAESVQRLRQQTSSFIDGLADALTSRGGDDAPPIALATARCLSGVAVGLTPRAESSAEGGEEPALLTESRSAASASSSLAVTFAPPVLATPEATQGMDQGMDESSAALKLQAAVRGRASRKFVGEIGWKTYAGLTRTKSSKAARKQSAQQQQQQQASSSSSSSSTTTSTALVAAPPKKSLLRRFRGFIRKMLRGGRKKQKKKKKGAADGPDRDSVMGQLESMMSMGLASIGLGGDLDDSGDEEESEGDGFVKTEGGAKNLQALGFDLQLELQLKLPKPEPAHKHKEKADAANGGADKKEKDAPMWVPVKFGLHMPKMKHMPKIKLQVLELQLQACARITHDMRDNELTIGFIKDAKGRGPSIQWDVEARMGRLELPDFIEDKLPAMLVSHLLSNFTPASPLKIPLDIEKSIQDSLVQNDEANLDEEIAQLEANITSLKERKSRLSSRNRK